MRFSLILLGLLAAPAPALAYIDPNAGGLLWQVLGPVFVFVAMAWTHLTGKARELMKKLRQKLRPPAPE